ncbi:PEPxxWA-CTERM sorting domain-containing protein, partial [Sandarakinorhabdus glacialis]|uniref:PEPxxWA-CTERM sorting domain-containing protein n=1 Tax=Sandarakinorhabdus glacialis TaxID=1614636 RepID=UPI00166DC34C
QINQLRFRKPLKILAIHGKDESRTARFGKGVSNYATGSHFSLDNFVGDAVGGVPEPATWGMMIVGFGLVGAAARRRKALAVTA